LLATPPIETTTFPLEAPGGTYVLIDVAAHGEPPASAPLNVTLFPGLLEPRFVPVIVTGKPIGPELGDRLVMLGVDPTLNITPLLWKAPTVTVTVPVVAPVGTGTAICVSAQLVGVAVVPLNVTLLVP
jgi:hypothetical protein